ncbi:hypothetical protein [Rhizobium sp. UGM030330-04]|uniref:capsular polysaccharide export protein, LipB/KpsS family n=1 Tax=Rhizobium sp. UGM030330-04 TaxID=1378077 RepID=UPI000D91A92E|nr:hypothetical protein [Rhizobium sp. UGM030330-04]PYG54371.1 capsular polysaccharide biosynthesis protein [Rhizobium sp. UGM030330-04]
MSINVILSDDVHLHQKNFSSLFSVLLETPNVQAKALTSGRDLWNRYGDYSGVTLVEDRAHSLEVLTREQLRALTGRAKGVTVNAFTIARSEILSFVLATCPNWYEHSIPNDDDFIFSKLYEENPAILRLNLAAVIIWCEIYSAEIHKISSVSAMIIFSGSQIYQRLLLSICSASRPRAFVVETFQTGTEFYFEERYSPITKGSDIRFESVFSNLTLPASPSGRQNEINKAQNKLLNAQNKNVKQPDHAEIPEFPENRPMLLIACQVQNDFSLIESDLEDINPLSNYKTLLDEIISQTEFNILVKTHPWEKNKTHLRTSFTRDHLMDFVAHKSPSYQARVAFCEDANLPKLLNSTDAFVTIVSQASFEACFYGGLKPYLLGRPFYSGRGFTSEHSNSHELANVLAQNSENHSLTLEQYSGFLDFSAKLLQLHLASVHKSGLPLIRSRLLPPQLVEVGVSSTPAVEKPQQSPSAKPAPIVTSLPPPNTTTHRAVAIPFYRKPMVFAVRPFVKLIGTRPDDVTKFNADPSGFFAKLKNPRYRLVGKVLFGTPK